MAPSISGASSGAPSGFVVTPISGSDLRGAAGFLCSQNLPAHNILWQMMSLWCSWTTGNELARAKKIHDIWLDLSDPLHGCAVVAAIPGWIFSVWASTVVAPAGRIWCAHCHFPRSDNHKVAVRDWLRLRWHDGSTWDEPSIIVIKGTRKRSLTASGMG
jgi:hypothetical protein